MASGDYIAYNFDSKEEIFNALLSMYPFASFEETDDGLIGYISAEELTDEVKGQVADLCVQHKVTATTNIIKPQNWNAQWEASFQPVEIEKFCRIRADFHEAVSGYTHDIVINPKMAFGTGHHETTWMMIKAMSSIDFTERSVFDYGAGTGVLAILAEKLGSQDIDALDIEVESFENTIENAEINNCSHITSIHGELDKIDGKIYDVILANINRHVLLTTASKLYDSLKTDGTLLMSGILRQDIQLITECYTDAGFKVAEIMERGNWRCIRFAI